MDKETFGRFIADTRRNAGMTQQALADRLHVTNTAVSKWERGLSYPDVTMLEELALALGLTLSELISCEKAAETITEETRLERNMTSLLDIANDFQRKQRIKMLWITLIVLLTTVVSVALVYWGITISSTNRCRAFYVGAQTKDGVNYIYMDHRGNLLCLRCEDQQMFDTIIYGDTEQDYTIEYRYNTIIGQGTLVHCEIFETLGSEMDQLGAEFDIGSLLGIDCAWGKYLNIYPDPNLVGQHLYTVQFFYVGDGTKYYHYDKSEPKMHIVTVKNFRRMMSFDYDNDGIVELFIRTKYDNAPYMLYDIENGTLSYCFVDNVPTEVQEYLEKIT